jgi:thiol-disulfide isomerase/thioredoxin/peroxiredoxin
MASEEEITQLLVDVKYGVKAFMNILRQPPEDIEKDEVQKIINSVTSTLEDIISVTDSDPVSEELARITRLVLQCCVKIYKQLQQGLDIDDSQEELHGLGGEFSQICQEFTQMVHKAFHGGGSHQQDDYTPHGDFSIQRGTINYINNESEFEEVLLVEDQYVVINISNDTQACQKLKPTFLELARSYPKVLFCYLDPSRARDISYIQGINRFPHFQVYFNTEKLREFSSATDSHLRSLVLQIVDPAAARAQQQQQQQQQQHQQQPQRTTNQSTIQTNTNTNTTNTAPKQPAKVARAAAPRADFNYSGFSSNEAGCAIEVHNSLQYDKLITNRSKIVAVCVTMDTPICNTATEKFKEYAVVNPHADFLIVNHGEMKASIPSIAAITNLPYFRFYKDGKLAKEFGGQFQDDYLRAAVHGIVVKAKPKAAGVDVVTSDFHTPGKVVVLTKEETYKTILSIPDVLIVINMYDHEKISQDMIQPFCKTAEKFHNAIFCSIDVNACRNSIRSCFGATRLPSFRFFKNGEKLKEWQGREPEYVDKLVIQFLKV